MNATVAEKTVFCYANAPVTVRLPVGAQFRSYEVPVCAAMALVLLLPPLCRHKLKRGQGWGCLALYFAYLAAALLLPRAGA